MPPTYFRADIDYKKLEDSPDDVKSSQGKPHPLIRRLQHAGSCCPAETSFESVGWGCATNHITYRVATFRVLIRETRHSQSKHVSR